VRKPGHNALSPERASMTNELVEVAWSGVADRDIVILPRS
jgi:hypothetical protein